MSETIGIDAFKSCGDCSLCCRLLDAPEIGKKDHEWCPHYRAGTGCTIHETRPELCRTFQCQWTRTGFLDGQWRPDRCHFILWGQAEGQLIVEVDPDHPQAWRGEPYYRTFKGWSSRMQVLVRVGVRMFMVFPEGDVDMGVQQLDKDIDWGYGLNFQGKRVPYARFVERRPTE